MKAESNIRPKNNFEIENIIDGNCEIVFFDNIEELEKEFEGEKIKNYVFDIYRLKTTFRDDLEIDLINNNDKLVTYKQKAVENENNELAAIIRKERDKLLEETDKEMSIDRLNLNFPENLNTINLLSAVKDFFEGLKNVSKGEMAKYRQALRDIPQQEGFPHNVIFPEKPKKIV